MTEQMRSAKPCLECGETLSPHQLFCPRCGQRADTSRLTMRVVAHELMRALIDVDRSVLSLLKSLATSPGLFARRYVAGARRRSFGPFAFLVIVIGVTSLLMALFKFEIVTSDKTNRFVGFVQSHPNLLLFAQVPLLALLCRLLFPRQGLTFAEHAVLVAYTSSTRVLFAGFVALPIWYFARDGASAQFLDHLYWAIWYAYFGFAASQFYSGNRAWSWLRGVGAAASTQTIIGFALQRAASFST